MLDVVKRRYANIRDRLALHQSYQRVFSTPDGERVLRHIAKVGMLTSSSFVAGDPHQTSLNEGKRLLALSILKFVRRDHGTLVEQIEKGMEQE